MSSEACHSLIRKSWAHQDRVGQLYLRRISSMLENLKVFWMFSRKESYCTTLSPAPQVLQLSQDPNRGCRPLTTQKAGRQDKTISNPQPKRHLEPYNTLNCRNCLTPLQDGSGVSEESRLVGVRA